MKEFRIRIILFWNGEQVVPPAISQSPPDFRDGNIQTSEYYLIAKFTKVVIDVLAKNETDAVDKAVKLLKEHERNEKV